MSRNTTSGDNVAVGLNALFFTTAGSNTAVGSNALAIDTTGTGNIALGFFAGQHITSGSNNIDIGMMLLNEVQRQEGELASQTDELGTLRALTDRQRAELDQQKQLLAEQGMRRGQVSLVSTAPRILTGAHVTIAANRRARGWCCFGLCPTSAGIQRLKRRAGSLTVASGSGCQLRPHK
jgi:hypothetical protein